MVGLRISIRKTDLTFSASILFSLTYVILEVESKNMLQKKHIYYLDISIILELLALRPFSISPD